MTGHRVSDVHSESAGGTGEGVPWHQRSRKEYGLRYEGVHFVLMYRYCDENGLDSSGQPSIWKDAADIKEWGHAKALLVACSAHEAALHGRDRQ